MQKKVCPNGHVYDPSIYGDQCPMCPSGGAGGSMSSGTQVDPETFGGGAATFNGGAAQPNFDGHTHIANPAPGIGMGGQPPVGRPTGAIPPNNVAGETRMRPRDAEPTSNAGGHTVIRRPGNASAAQAAPGRKLVGFLVSYNRDPLGKAYNLYEGRNYIGRDHSCDICVNDDTQMSGRHMSILYRNVDDKFKFRDEQSSNGTFINKQLLDDGELQNYDIIRVGSTLFIFIAIPKIG